MPRAKLGSLDEFTPVAQARKISDALPILREVQGKQEKMVKTKVFQAISGGTFTSELAFSAWHELYALHRTFSSFEGRQKLGETIAEREAAAFMIGEEN
jgi:hypothetical protein